MAHFPGHEGPGGGGQQFAGQFAPEFQSGSFLQSIQAGIEPARRQEELRLGQLARTRQLSPAQEAFVLSQGREAQSGALINARFRADAIRAQQEQRERLIGEARQFQVAEERRRFEREAALREQEQRQGLLGSIFGDIGGLGGTLIGSALGGPVGGAVGGGLF